MKKYIIGFASLFFLASCNDSAKVASSSDSTDTTSEMKIDTAQAKTEVGSLMDAVYNGYRQKDLSLIEKSFTADALVLGTDPKEIWPFSQFSDSIRKLFGDTSFHGIQYLPVHQISVHENSAIIVDQLQLNEISKKMMTRNISHARYENGKWLLDFLSWNSIPKNEDLAKIDKAL